MEGGLSSRPASQAIEFVIHGSEGHTPWDRYLSCRIQLPVRTTSLSGHNTLFFLCFDYVIVT